MKDKILKSKKHIFRNIILTILGLTVVLLLFSFIRHRVLLEREKDILTPPGQMIDVDGHQMHVYSVGEGDKTLVLMAASGTVCPSLDFKNLYTGLGDDYRIVVVEKFGYGYSDIVNRPRDVAAILSDTRAALNGAGIDGPYILCPHSYSGLEALYWAQTYPDEVEAIIGLDMAFPEAYNYTKGGILVKPYYLAQHGLIDLGIGRFFPDSTFLPEGGFLSGKEEQIYIALVNRISNNIDVAMEASAAKESAALVDSGAKPDVPMLLFLSEKKLDGSNELWKNIAYDYADGLSSVVFVELDCGHYIHHYEAEHITEEIKAFLQDLD
ncbi:MAG: alpha/beta hydrolase [Lachnospiraceae bacterium]|nr:alpha/beta hydrolase [Clostridiales bacterium]MBR7090062.1 alpha/beta hydrolase [Lachnospiraceae bacterium]